MFMQDPVLGLAAISLYPIQAYVIPKLQRQVNLLGKERVRTVRALSDKLGESVSGVQEVHANDAARLMLARFARSEEHTSELQSLMRISYAVFCWKKKHRHN